jgi:Family of unknown function (DUF6112)
LDEATRPELREPAQAARMPTVQHDAATAQATMVVSGVNIQPNRTGLPGIASLETIVGALLTFGLVAAVAGIAISAIAWAIGSHSGNPHVAGKGKSGVLIALGAGFLIGGATFLVNFFNTQGGHLS